MLFSHCKREFIYAKSPVHYLILTLSLLLFLSAYHFLTINFPCLWKHCPVITSALSRRHDSNCVYPISSQNFKPNSNNHDELFLLLHGCRSFQTFISHTDPDTLAAFSGGKADVLRTEMVKTASNVIGKMSPEELQKLIQMASSFQGENPFLNKGSSDNFGPGSVPPNVTPDMLKMATDIMGKMSPEEML